MKSLSDTGRPWKTLGWVRTSGNKGKYVKDLVEESSLRNNKEVSTSRIVRDKSGPPITRSYDMLGFLDAARPCTLLQAPIATPYVSGD